MKGRRSLVVGGFLVLVLALAVGPGQAQGPDPQGEVIAQADVGTAFTYQGQLTHEGSPADGGYDLRFRLYDAATGGSQVGPTRTRSNVTVRDGLFTVALDFGDVFDGTALWLLVSVRPTGVGTYSGLSPRQPLTPAPYAIYAAQVGDHDHWGQEWSGTEGIGLRLSVPEDSSANRGLSASGWIGVRGETSSHLGSGVSGRHSHDTGSGSGVYGSSSSPASAAVKGYASAGAGVHGISAGTGTPALSGRGVYGQASAHTGTTYGVYGRSASDEGHGVYGWATATTGETRGVYGRSDSSSDFTYAVYGYATAESGRTYGVMGESASTTGRGVWGWATATTGYTRGVFGRVRSDDGRGVFGYADSDTGTTFGVYGRSDSDDGWAGYFHGHLGVTGDLSVVGSKAFKIDHPLDPAGRYLYHFAQEAPEVQNVYNGVVTLDATGAAVVSLPDYFAALNAGPFRYQLTPIGAAMPNLHIAEEIRDNQFAIAGGVPGAKVSWEVTAVRNDPYLRDHPMVAEQDKSTDEQGTYLYPEGYGQPEEMGLDYQRDAHLLDEALEAADPSPMGNSE